ncbi:MAG: hypothetical protein ACR2RB_02625 [Gammaproteobacteria bacterium]
MLRKSGLNTVFATVLTLMLSAPAQAAEGKRIQVTGEVMDTWCYVSQVMGGADFVLGSAHHTCAVWCAAGGVPVGIRTDDDKVYMVLKFGEDNDNVANLGVLDVQSRKVSVDGTLHERDGINYLLVDKIVDDKGIVNLTHEQIGVLPPFAIPKQ